MRATTRTTALLAAGLLASAGGGGAQTAAPSGAEVFGEALDRYEARMGDVESYTVVQDFMGFESTILWVPEMVDGRRVFSPRRSRTAVAPGEVAGEGVDHLGNSSWDDPFRHFLEWGRGAVLERSALLDERPVWVVRVEGFGGANFGLTPGTFAEGHFEPKIGWFYFDRRSFQLHRIEAEGFLLYGGRALEVTVTADLRDYRTVRGMVHPFEIALNIAGIPSATSAAEQAAARLQRDELQAQIDSLPEGEGATLRSLLEAQIERLRGLSEGRIALTLRVRDLQVQVAAPDR